MDKDAEIAALRAQIVGLEAEVALLRRSMREVQAVEAAGSPCEGTDGLPLIAAIKLVRGRLGLSLAEAKCLVDRHRACAALKESNNV